MSYKTASFRINPQPRHYNARAYNTSASNGDVELKIIKISIISLILLIFLATTVILNNLYNKNMREIYAQKEYHNSLVNQYKMLTEEKNNFFTQKLHNEYGKKLGLHPPKENQIIRLRD